MELDAQYSLRWADKRKFGSLLLNERAGTIIMTRLSEHGPCQELMYNLFRAWFVNGISSNVMVLDSFTSNEPEQLMGLG